MAEKTLTDATGQVSMSWFDGTLDAVTIRPTWRDHLSPTELATAVTALYLTDDAVPQAPAALWVDEGPTPSTKDPLAVRSILESLASLRQRLLAVSDAATAAARSRELQFEPTVTNPANLNVAVVSDGARLVGIEFREQWIETASAAAISGALTDTLVRFAEEPPAGESASTLPPEFLDIRRQLDQIGDEIGLRRVTTPEGTS